MQSNREDNQKASCTLAARHMKRVKFKPKPKALCLGAVCCVLLLFLVFLLLKFSNLNSPQLKTLEHHQELIRSSEQVHKHQVQLKYYESEFKINSRVELFAQLREHKLEPSELLAHNSTQLLNLKNVTFHYGDPTGSSNVIQCDCDDDDDATDDTNLNGRQTQLFIVINSRLDNFERRQKLRSSWLERVAIKRQVCSNQITDRFIAPRLTPTRTPTTLRGRRAINQYRTSARAPSGARTCKLRIEYVFVLAAAAAADDQIGAPEAEVAQRVREESREYGDVLVVGNLREHYHNLTLKHLAIYKWLLVRTAGERDRTEYDPLVLKCDDDAQVDLEQLFDLYDSEQLYELASDRTKSLLMCAQFPQHSFVQRHEHVKWHLTHAEWPYDTFPAYCSGLAYLTSMQLIEQLYLLAHLMQANSSNHQRHRGFREPLWIDDVYVTGVLVQALAPERLHLVKLNAYFCYTRAQRERRQLELGARCMASEDYNY